MSLLAGLDVGTTGCKVTVFTPDGKCLGREYRTYKTRRLASVHEVDAESLAEGVMEVVAAASAACGAAKWKISQALFAALSSSETPSGFGGSLVESVTVDFTNCQTNFAFVVESVSVVAIRTL